MPSVHVKCEHGFRPIGILKRFTQLRNSNVKYKFSFYKASSVLSPLSLLKLPIVYARRPGRGFTESKVHRQNTYIVILVSCSKKTDSCGITAYKVVFLCFNSSSVNLQPIDANR